MHTSIYTKFQIKHLINDLNLGNVVALGTDTVMGLVARIDMPQAFIKLKEIKGRSANKPFPIMVSSLTQLNKIALLTKRDLKLIDKWFPGPITFIFNKNPNYKNVGIGDTIAIRIPDDEILNEIVAGLDRPIFLTSANKSNQPTTKLASEVLKIFDKEVASILMHDALGYKASTIIDATGEKLKEIRAGKISLKRVLESLEELDER